MKGENLERSSEPKQCAFLLFPASVAKSEEMRRSNKGDENAPAGSREALQVAAESRVHQNPHHRAVLGVLTENGQCLRPCGQVNYGVMLLGLMQSNYSPWYFWEKGWKSMSLWRSAACWSRLLWVSLRRDCYAVRVAC